MTDRDKRFDDFEAFLTADEGQSKEDAIAELRAHGVDTEAFLAKARRVVQEGYRRQLKTVAQSEQATQAAAPGFLANLKSMPRAAMQAVFARVREGEFGIQYRELALARCRNKDASELSDEELRSWLEDVGDILGEPVP